MTVPTRYRAAPATDLIVRALDDITLIYHRPSSQTHMVASPVPEILDALRTTPLTAPLPEREGPGVGSERSEPPAHATHTPAEILTTLTTHFDLGDPATARPVIAAHLEEMVALGLVHRA
ncbi:MAG: HPr-rel-A system PqqD family peptide chaperone [Pseudomonadota bacterium]